MRRPILAALMLVLTTSAQARDDRLLFSIPGTLATPDGRDRFDDTIRFFWGEQPHGNPTQRLGIFTAVNKVNALTKTDQQACQAAFLAALASLRDEARLAGANAVVNIKSLYQGREFVSDVQFECRAGYLTTTVELEGRVVKLPTPADAARLEAEKKDGIKTTPVPDSQ